jgi:hypothetical protein
MWTIWPYAVSKDNTPTDALVRKFGQVVADYLVHVSVRAFAEFCIQDYQI